MLKKIVFITIIMISVNLSNVVYAHANLLNNVDNCIVENKNICNICNNTGFINCTQCQGTNTTYKYWYACLNGHTFFSESNYVPQNCSNCKKMITNHGIDYDCCLACNPLGKIKCYYCNGCFYCHGQRTIKCSQCIGTGIGYKYYYSCAKGHTYIGTSNYVPLKCKTCFSDITNNGIDYKYFCFYCNRGKISCPHCENK